MRKMFFTNDAGNRLAGRLELPTTGGPPWPTAVFAHGFDSGKDSPRGVAVASRLCDVGIAAFLFDFTGHGESEGAKAESTINRQIGDLKSSIDFVMNLNEPDGGRIGVVGASSGGLVALAEALIDRRVKALALRGPRTDDMTARAAEFDIPILIIQGELDPLLPESQAFYQALAVEKDLRVLEGADHLFSSPKDLQTVAELTARWLKQKLVDELKTAA